MNTFKHLRYKRLTKNHKYNSAFIIFENIKGKELYFFIPNYSLFDEYIIPMANDGLRHWSVEFTNHKQGEFGLPCKDKTIWVLSDVVPD